MLSLKDNKFTDNIVDCYSRNYVDAKGIGGEQTKALDENAHQQAAEYDAKSGSQIKEQNFHKKAIFPTMEYPENICDVSNHIGEKKGTAVTDHRVSGSSRIV